MTLTENQVVHCSTQEEWDRMLKYFDYFTRERSMKWVKHKVNSCLRPIPYNVCSIKFYKDRGREIISSFNIDSSNSTPQNPLLHLFPYLNSLT